MERAQIQEKLDRISLYLIQQRVNVGFGKNSTRQWEDLQEAIGIIEAARKSL